MRSPKSSSTAIKASPYCGMVRGQDKHGGLFWRGYVLWHHRQLASRNFFDSTYGGEGEAGIAANAWFELASALVREVFPETMAYDDEVQLAAFKDGIASISARFDAERPRWVFLSVYVVYWSKRDPNAQQLRFLVSDRGQAMQRREGAVNVSVRKDCGWPEALAQLRARIHGVMTGFFGEAPADTFMARHGTMLSPDRFDPDLGLKVWERLDQLAV
jgi:hypothetical protein